MLEPEFPPLLTGRRIIEGQSVLAAAIAGARATSLGAGDVLWDDHPARVELAILLEPEVPLTGAAQMLPVAMAAAGDCIGVLSPPQVGVMFRWPGEILVNGASVGRISLVSDRCRADAVPDWMVVHLTVRLQNESDEVEPGYVTHMTSLSEEGGENLTNVQLIESYSRHFLTWLNLWQDDGFKAVHGGFLERLCGQDEPIQLDAAGDEPITVLGLDEDGNLLVRQADGATAALPLLDAVEMPAPTS